MGALRQRISDRIFARVDFKNQALETAIKGLANQSFSLADAANAVENRATALELDVTAVTNGALGLAEQFGESFPAPSPDRTAAIKGFVNELIDEDDAELEAAVESLFSAMFDFEVKISNTNTDVDVIVPE